MKRYPITFAQVLVACALAASVVSGQTPAQDPSARLKEVLPADVAQRVLAKIADARAHGLPAAALEKRALKFAAKGVDAKAIEKSVDEHADRMKKTRDALDKSRGSKAAADEIEAGAEAIRKGVDGAKVSELAKSAPSGRSLAVPLYVIGSLVDRGLPSDSALKRVLARLQARVADRDLEKMPADVREHKVAVKSHRPAQTGRDLAATKRPGSAGGAASAGHAGGGPPAGVPANGGKAVRPATPGGKPTTTGKPATNPGKRN